MSSVEQASVVLSHVSENAFQVQTGSYKEIWLKIWHVIVNVCIYTIIVKSRQMAANLLIAGITVNVPQVDSQPNFKTKISDEITSGVVNNLERPSCEKVKISASVNEKDGIAVTTSCHLAPLNLDSEDEKSSNEVKRNLCSTLSIKNHQKSDCGSICQIRDEKLDKEITCDELATLLNNNVTMLLIDCRSFMDFNANHIHTAININCTNRITKKRLADGKVTVVEAISCLEGKKLYRNLPDDSEIIVYDEKTCKIEGLQASHSLKLVMDCLKNVGKSAKYLKGGLRMFEEQYLPLCTGRDPTNVPLLFSPTSPDINCDIDNAVISQISPNLYIGNQRDAMNKECLQRLGITHVINVTSHLPFYFENDGIIYKRLSATDSGHQNLKQYFAEAIRFIDEAIECDGKVLVHCEAGVSRSPTIVLAYLLARTQHKNLLDAFAFIKGIRAIVAPNLNFMGQLLEFEQTTVEKKGLCVPQQSISLL